MFEKKSVCKNRMARSKSTWERENNVCGEADRAARVRMQLQQQRERRVVKFVPSPTYGQ